MSRIISKALPIRFWLDGQEVPNEQDVPGIESHVWNQKWTLTDVIRLQVIDSEDKIYGVSIQNVDDNSEIGSKVFSQTEVTEDDYETVLHYRNDISFTFEELGVTSGQVVRVVLMEGTDYPLDSVTGYSDCLDVQDEQWGTFPIDYTNEYDYAGIAFEGLGLTFTIRVEGRFFKQKRTRETESEGLSDESVVVLGTESKRQKTLEVELAPFHFHDQLILILGSNKITIAEDGTDVDWSGEEAYEMEEADDRSPFYKAKCILTKKDDEFFTNVYGEP